MAEALATDKGKARSRGPSTDIGRKGIPDPGRRPGTGTRHQVRRARQQVREARRLAELAELFCAEQVPPEK